MKSAITVLEFRIGLNRQKIEDLSDKDYTRRFNKDKIEKIIQQLKEETAELEAAIKLLGGEQPPDLERVKQFYDWLEEPYTLEEKDGVTTMEIGSKGGWYWTYFTFEDGKLANYYLSE